MGYTIFMNLAAAKISVRPRKNTAEGGFAGNAFGFRSGYGAKQTTLSKPTLFCYTRRVIN